jgi:hypothetical protein
MDEEALCSILYEESPWIVDWDSMYIRFEKDGTGFVCCRTLYGTRTTDFDLVVRLC